jgi:hypothetical protein
MDTFIQATLATHVQWSLKPEVASDELKATISSYGGNTAAMAKSFVMALRSVAQTSYSSLRPGTITSW